MIALAVTCPACGAALTLKAAPPPGVTRAKCPKCGGVVPLDSVDPAPPSGHETAGLNASANSTSDATCPGPGRPAPASDEFPFLAPPERPDEIGRLGPYRVLAAIGHGGMGAVFRAEDPALRRHVALKVMLPQFATTRSRKLDSSAKPARRRPSNTTTSPPSTRSARTAASRSSRSRS